MRLNCVTKTGVKEAGVRENWKERQRKERRWWSKVIGAAESNDASEPIIKFTIIANLTIDSELVVR